MLDKDSFSPYLKFSRPYWSELRNSVPLTLSEKDIKDLQGINDKLSIEEVVDIYLPLSRLLNLYVENRQRRSTIQQEFIGHDMANVPYVIGIAGSVAVGKSTTARILQALLSCWSDHPKVALLTTDGFLRPNAQLEERGIMNRKGFPESYDIKRLLNFVADVKSGKPVVRAPIYSHLTYDIVPDQYEQIVQPDILILEGLNVLQSGVLHHPVPRRLFVSDFVDFSIFVDAEIPQLEEWYIQRFLKFRSGAFSDPGAYFHHYAKLSEDEAIETARRIWREINEVNLKQNVLPTRERADLILRKGANHQIEKVLLKK